MNLNEGWRLFRTRQIDHLLRPTIQQLSVIRIITQVEIVFRDVRKTYVRT